MGNFLNTKGMKLFEADLRFTHDREILMGIPNKPDNAVIYYIGNYPNEEIMDKIDKYCKRLRPPNEYWDDVIATGNSREQGSGWNSTGFEPKYKEHIVNNDKAWEQARQVKAKAKSRPVYIGHHPTNKMYSPARVCIQVLETMIDLE